MNHPLWTDTTEEEIRQMQRAWCLGTEMRRSTTRTQMRPADVRDTCSAIERYIWAERAAMFGAQPVRVTTAARRVDWASVLMWGIVWAFCAVVMCGAIRLLVWAGVTLWRAGR